MEAFEGFLADPVAVSPQELASSFEGGARGLLSAFETHRRGAEAFREFSQSYGAFSEFLDSIGAAKTVTLLANESFANDTLKALFHIDLFSLAMDPLEIGLALLELAVAPDTELGNTAKDLLSAKYSVLLRSPSLLQKLSALCISVDSTTLLRLLELGVNADSETMQALDTTELFTQGLALFTSEDLLLRLSAIEVLGQLANSPQGCAKLLAPEVVQVVSRSLSDSSEESYTRNYFAELASKVYCHTGNSVLLTGDYWEYLLELLSSGSASHVNKGLTCAYLLSHRSPLVFSGNSALIQALGALQRSSHKSQFYETLSKLLSHASPSDAHAVLELFDWRVAILAEIRAPFTETLESLLQFVLSLTQHPQAATSLLSCAEFAEFLLSRKQVSSQLSHLKFSVVSACSSLNLDPLLSEKFREYVHQGVFAAPTALLDEVVNNAE